MRKTECPIPETEWNFDNVPESELEVCRLWEYARESALLQHTRLETGTVALIEIPDGESLELDLNLSRLEKVRKRFYWLFGHLNRRAILFQEGIYQFEGADPGFVSPFPAPWLSLPKATRSVLVATAEWSARSLGLFPGFRRGDAPYASALANFKPKTMKEVFGDGEIGVREFFHAGRKLRGLCPNILYRSGTEVFIATIDWGYFTNQALTAEFSQWLKENRPEETPGPSGRGRKFRDLRVALDRLGMMRLLHRFKLAEMKEACPRAWKAFQDFDWYKERKRAGQTFRTLFPFLPQPDQPLSWATKGRRAK